MFWRHNKPTNHQNLWCTAPHAKLEMSKTHKIIMTSCSARAKDSNAPDFPSTCVSVVQRKPRVFNRIRRKKHSPCAAPFVLIVFRDPSQKAVISSWEMNCDFKTKEQQPQVLDWCLALCSLQLTVAYCEAVHPSR